jgi:hypothetical protein
LTTASAQTNSGASAAKATYESAINVRPQYEAALKQKRDGKFLLYTDDEGTKLFLPVNGSQPGPPIAVGKGGGPWRPPAPILDLESAQSVGTNVVTVLALSVQSIDILVRNLFVTRFD